MSASGDVTISAGGSLTLKATGTVAITGSQVNIN
jgi:hypothetical protein